MQPFNVIAELFMVHRNVESQNLKKQGWEDKKKVLPHLTCRCWLAGGVHVCRQNGRPMRTWFAGVLAVWSSSRKKSRGLEENAGCMWFF